MLILSLRFNLLINSWSTCWLQKSTCWSTLNQHVELSSQPSCPSCPPVPPPKIPIYQLSLRTSICLHNHFQIIISWMYRLLANAHRLKKKEKKRPMLEHWIPSNFCLAGFLAGWIGWLDGWLAWSNNRFDIIILWIMVNVADYYYSNTIHFWRILISKTMNMADFSYYSTPALGICTWASALGISTWHLHLPGSCNWHLHLEALKI